MDATAAASMARRSICQTDPRHTGEKDQGVRLPRPKTIARDPTVKPMDRRGGTCRASAVAQAASPVKGSPAAGWTPHTREQKEQRRRGSAIACECREALAILAQARRFVTRKLRPEKVDRVRQAMPVCKEARPREFPCIRCRRAGAARRINPPRNLLARQATSRPGQPANVQL